MSCPTAAQPASGLAVPWSTESRRAEQNQSAEARGRSVCGVCARGVQWAVRFESRLSSLCSLHTEVDSEAEQRAHSQVDATRERCTTLDYLIHRISPVSHLSATASLVVSVYPFLSRIYRSQVLQLSLIPPLNNVPAGMHASQ